MTSCDRVQTVGIENNKSPFPELLFQSKENKKTLKVLRLRS